MNYHICATTTEQRKAAQGEYIVALSKNVKNRENIDKYAVVKHLFVNKLSSPFEYREMVAIAKIVVDNSLSDDCICVDQSIRNAIGIPFGHISNITIKLANLKLVFSQKIFDLFHPGNYFFARIHKPDVVDIEKNFCRIKSDAIQVMGAIEGKTIIFEKPVSLFEMQVGEGFSKYYACGEESLLSAFEPYTEQINEIDFSDYLQIDGCHIGSNCILSVLKDTNLMQDKKDKLISSLFEICDWHINSQFTRINMMIPVFPLQSESIDRMTSIMRSQNEVSFFSRYPDAEKIFAVNPDINGVYMDKYFRDKLHCNLLDCVRIKRNRLVVIMSEIMEYGLMFAISVVAIMLSLFGQNRLQNAISILVASAITIYIIMKRTK